MMLWPVLLLLLWAAASRHSAGSTVLRQEMSDGVPNCGAVVESKLAPCSSRTWRWTISESYNSNGPTVHWLQFGNASGWMNSSAWTVSAKSHPNGPAANLLRGDNTSFWNADQPGAPRHGAPWTATIKTAGTAITPSLMRYSIFFAGNAPMAFKVECLQDIAWTAVASVEDAGCGQACSCPHRPAPSPPADSSPLSGPWMTNYTLAASTDPINRTFSFWANRTAAGQATWGPPPHPVVEFSAGSGGMADLGGGRFLATPVLWYSNVPMKMPNHGGPCCNNTVVAYLSTDAGRSFHFRSEIANKAQVNARWPSIEGPNEVSG